MVRRARANIIQAVEENITGRVQTLKRYAEKNKNLPQQVQLEEGRSLKNRYAADERKLEVEAQYSTGEYEAYRSYSGNLVFDANDNLDHIVIPEGRIVHRNGTFTFEYHLSNVRVAFVPEKGVVQENTYYPFGGLIRDYTYSSNGWVENKLRYNGKELLGEFDLGWYDYGSRYYNPMLGMFTTVDPQAYRGYGWGTYAYGLDNPLKYTDPDGGASGGFLTGFSNSLVQEKGLSAVLGSGAIGGLMGGVGGGIMGGVWGGIDAAIDGRRFFDGATVQTMMLRVMDPGTGGFRNIPLSKIINLFTITP